MPGVSPYPVGGVGGVCFHWFLVGITACRSVVPHVAILWVCFRITPPTSELGRAVLPKLCFAVGVLDVLNHLVRVFPPPPAVL